MFDSSFRTLAFALTGILIGAAASAACSADDSGGSASNFGGGGSGGAGGSGGGDGSAASGGSGGTGAGGTGNSGGIDMDGAANDAPLDPDAACDLQTFEATLVKKPVDIIFVIDNSCSMSNENQAVASNVNVNFANIIQGGSIDYRVIMLTSHEGGYEVKVGPPLSQGSTPTVPGNNPPIFYHYDYNVASHNALCLLFDRYAQPDKHAFSQGWKDWLRPEAFKLFVPITDDGTTCSSTATGNSYSDGDTVAGGQTAAQQWDQDLLALDPTQFGTAAERNYVFYSILGMPANNPASAPWLPTDPVITGTCPTGVDPGTAYQWLSNMTGGLKFPVCEGQGFDVVFQKLAEGVIKGAKVACDFPMPTPPEGKELDPATITIEYTPGGGGTPQKFTQVANAGACQPGSFYIEADQLKLCPDTCTQVQGDDKAGIKIFALCKGGPPT